MVGHLDHSLAISGMSFLCSLFGLFTLEIYVCFLKLCRPSEMPQSMASCWTLHCFMHVWWIYISLDRNFCAVNHLIERLLICKGYSCNLDTAHI